ncbi:YceD family protein [soil metagenome]
MRPVRRSAPAPVDLAVELIGVPQGSPLDLDLRLESVMEGVLVSGTVTGRIAGQCGRCLDPFTAELTVDVQELFVYPDSTTDETTERDEVPRIEHGLLDLEPVVRDVVVLALPLTPLCRPDCAGLCAGCGGRLDDLPEDHRHELTDRRWAALAEKFGGDSRSREDTP